MFQAQQASNTSLTYFSHQSLPVNLPYPVLASEPPLHPPGIDPHGTQISYPPVHGGFDGQPTVYQDPNAVSQNWVVQQADQITQAANGSWVNPLLVNDVSSITSGTIQNGNLGQMISGSSVLAVDRELTTKTHKLLQGGTAVDSVRVCTICNVVCNSQTAFSIHLAGRKHAAQATAKLLSAAGLNQTVQPYYNSAFKKGLKKPKIAQSSWCEVCKINCNSYEILSTHRLGKRHMKNLENLEKSKNTTGVRDSTAVSATTNPTIGPMENPATSNSNNIDLQKSKRKAAVVQVPEQDLETKKRKVVQGGAAAAAVRVCTICNVVCNSYKVFNSHLTGQKHAAMVKKQAEAGMASAGPPSLAAA